MVDGQSRILTLKNGYHVWTRRVGQGRIKVLTLHGGPGCTHEYMEVLERHLPDEGVELYYYDQLGSYGSDQPDDLSLWTVDRFREEVEEVRQQLGLDDFYLYGQSWGGMLSIEYALAHQEHLRGLVISNMTASIDAYGRYLKTLREALPQAVQDELAAYEAREAYFDPRYQELLLGELYTRHLCRLRPWPDPVQRCFDHLALPVYMTMQGPNEFVVTGNFASWNRWEDLSAIRVPTLVIGGRHDTMNPADLEEMGRRLPDGRTVICDEGSHLAMWDDEEAYHRHLIAFLQAVEARRT